MTLLQVFVMIAVTVLLLLFGLLSLPQVNAQNPPEFTAFQNRTLGFSIQYPSQWVVKQTVFPDQKVVEFKNNSSTIGTFFVRIKAPSPNLDSDAIMKKNKTLEQTVHDLVAGFSKPNPYGLEIKLIGLDEFPILGEDGWKVEMTTGSGTRIFYYAFDILTIINGKLYSLEYQDKPSKIGETLPIAKKMVNSFRLVS